MLRSFIFFLNQRKNNHKFLRVIKLIISSSVNHIFLLIFYKKVHQRDILTKFTSNGALSKMLGSVVDVESVSDCNFLVELIITKK